jgi:hypothetical protein
MEVSKLPPADVPAARVGTAAASGQGPQSALLQALPENAGDAPAWTAAVVRVEASMQSSMERAIAIVTQWRDVHPVVVDAVKEMRTLVFSALGDEPQNPLWLRPEWVGLAPGIRRFWRRRRNARRRLTDPDYSAGSLDEGEECHR